MDKFNFDIKKITDKIPDYLLKQRAELLAAKIIF